MKYTRAELDHQYDTRAWAPDAAAHLAEVSRRSEDARRRYPAWFDLPYGAAAPERIDVFTPRAGPAPVQVFIHGGFWRSRAKEDVSLFADLFVPAGAVFVAVEYALAPAATLDLIVDQCRRALAWVAENIDRYGGDAAQIFVSGHSAGAHLAAMVLATDWRANFRLPADVVKGACLTSGLYDLDPIRHSSLNEVLVLDDEGVRRNSPIHHRPSSPAPVVLAWGGDESDEFKRQSHLYDAACREWDVPVDGFELAGRHHFSIAPALIDPSSRLARAVLAQMGLERGA